MLSSAENDPNGFFFPLPASCGFGAARGRSQSQMAGEPPSGCRRGEAPAAWLLGGSGNWNDAVQLNAAVSATTRAFY